MFTILIAVMLIDTGGHAVAVSTSTLGTYEDVALCTNLARSLEFSSKDMNTDRRLLTRTAQCILAKDKK